MIYLIGLAVIIFVVAPLVVVYGGAAIYHIVYFVFDREGWNKEFNPKKEL